LEESKVRAAGSKRKRADSDSELSPEPEPQNPLEVLGLAEPQPAVTPKPSRADLKELRDRLQERITQLRAKRGAANKDPEAQGPPKKKQKKDKDKKKKNKNTKGANVEEKGHNAHANGVENNNKGSNKRKRSESNSNPSSDAGASEQPTEQPTKVSDHLLALKTRVAKSFYYSEIKERSKRQGRHPIRRY